MYSPPLPLCNRRNRKPLCAGSMSLVTYSSRNLRLYVLYCCGFGWAGLSKPRPLYIPCVSPCPYGIVIKSIVACSPRRHPSATIRILSDFRHSSEAVFSYQKSLSVPLLSQSPFEYQLHLLFGNLYTLVACWTDVSIDQYPPKSLHRCSRKPGP